MSFSANLAPVLTRYASVRTQPAQLQRLRLPAFNVARRPSSTTKAFLADPAFDRGEACSSYVASERKILHGYRLLCCLCMFWKVVI